MSDGQTIIRVRKGAENPYTVMLNAPLNDERLSWAARGMLAYLLSKPDDWKVSTAHLIASSPVGRDAVRAIFQELERYGYVTREVTKDSNGKFAGMDITVHEVPVALPETDLPAPAFPAPARPAPANPPLLNTETKQSTDELNPPAAAPPRRGRERDVLFDAFVEAWGYDPAKPAAKIRGLAGDFSARVRRANPGIPVATLLLAWHEFVGAEKRERLGGSRSHWGSVIQAHNSADQFLAWLTVNGPNAGRVWGEGAIRDDRWYFVDHTGKMSLKAPRLAIEELGLDCDPRRPDTWPRDMHEAYRSRLVLIDGEEVFA